MRGYGILAVIVATFSSSVAAQEQAPECGLYTYRAEIVRVVDGDTVVANVDLGFNIWRHDEHLRLVGIDTPEHGKDGAKEATEALRQRVESRMLYICNVKAKRSDREATGSFHRYLVTIYDNGENVNAWMIEEGHAVPYQD